MAEKVTTMIIKVDLGCHSCYKKIKKILSKFPQIQDQVYDEKQNTVKIKVVCCSPEKIRDKLCRKGGKTIKSVEIKEPEKKKEPEKGETKKEPEKKKEPEPEKKKEPEKIEKKKEPEPEKEKEPEKKKGPNPAPDPVPAYPTPYPVGFCCGSCAEGYFDGPCYHGYGMPPPPPLPPPYYDPFGRPCYGRPVYVSRCDYFSEENPSGCTIM